MLAALAGGNYLLGDGRQAGDLRVAMALDREILEIIRPTASAAATTRPIASGPQRIEVAAHTVRLLRQAP